MDAIAGIIYPDTFQINNLITPMLDTLKHRGGGIQDTCTVKNLQLGTCGHRLTANEKKSLIVGIDGNLTNIDDLINALETPLHSQSAAEVVLKGYEKWGTDLFWRLEGDFAIMIYDGDREQIVLARDRIGKKPLYWYQDQHHFIFASELKALLRSGAVPQAIARDAFAAYLYLGYIPQDMTPIKDVSKLLPAYYMVVHTNMSKSIQPYWSYSSCFKNKVVPKEIVVKTLDTLLTRSVGNSIPATPHPIGCFVSGGIGSASVAYYTKKVAFDYPIKAYSVGFQTANPEDVAASHEVAHTLNMPHQTGMITPDNLLNDLVKIVWHLDEPLADPNIVATWNLASLASKDTHTVFSGMGSDELLAGHDRYTIEERHMGFQDKMRVALLPILKHSIIPLLKCVYKPWAYHLIKKARTNPWQFEYIHQNALFDSRQIEQVAPKLAGLFDPEVFLHKFQSLFSFQSNVASFLYFDIKTRLPDCFLLQYERLTAAHGLNWRTPFLDQNIIEFLATLSEPQQMEEEETAAYLKPLLKETFSKALIQRPKVTRPNFLLSWLDNPKLRETFELLKNGVLVNNGIISRECLEAGLSGGKKCHDPFRCIWSILVLELWYRMFITQSITDSPPEVSVNELLTGKYT